MNCLAARMSQNLVESASKLHVEDGVDEWIEETVDVAEPDEEAEQQRIKMTHRAVVEQVVANTDGVDNVDCEERNPAEHEHACQHRTTLT